jgi:putative ABC transport system permease protein
MDSGYTGEILLTWDIAIEAMALATGTTLVASILPSWKASRMQIVDALRHNR